MGKCYRATAKRNERLKGEVIAFFHVTRGLGSRCPSGRCCNHGRDGLSVRTTKKKSFTFSNNRFYLGGTSPTTDRAPITFRLFSTRGRQACRKSNYCPDRNFRI